MRMVNLQFPILMSLVLACGTDATGLEQGVNSPPVLPAPPPPLPDTTVTPPPPPDTTVTPPPPPDTTVTPPPPPDTTVTPPPPPPDTTVTPPPPDTTVTPPPPPDTTVTPPPPDTTVTPPPPPDTTVTPPPPDTTITPPPPPTPGGPVLGLNGSFQGMRIFPGSDPWNTPVDQAPVDPASDAIIARIGATDRLHPDFGANWNGGPFGIPYIVVPDTLTRSPVSFDYASESDPGPYPIPPDPPIEPGNGDRHLIVVVQGERKAYELYNLRWQNGGWRAGSGAIWDLVNGTTRPAGWTSADAAGLPILPGLVRYDEVYELGEINHAIRFTVSRTRRAYIPPATHWASSSTDPLDLPMGARLRLKASFDISGYSPPARVILRAMKKYGLILADNGSDFYITGTADSRWNDSVNNALKNVRAGDFEVVRMEGVVTP